MVSLARGAANLDSRTDGYQGVFEYACYDNLNRLTQYAVGNGATACTSAQNNKTVDYDALGNITSKSDVGSYSYPAAGQARPHAVAGITGTVNGVVNPSYTYDANGNMTAGAGRTVTYTPFNMTNTITQGSRTVSFMYDPEHRRMQKSGDTEVGLAYMNDPYSGARTEYEAGSTGRWCDYILVPERGLAAIDEAVKSCTLSGAVSISYFTHDHLGSVATVTDQSGNVIERDAYDAWGKRRNLNGSDDPTCSIASSTTRGFTGHEQIDAECLINANARIYDPTLGRFMSADSIIPAPLDLQSYNRYAYVSNNPLSVTDPSGHENCDAACMAARRRQMDTNSYCPDTATYCYVFGGNGRVSWGFGGDTIAVPGQLTLVGTDRDWLGTKENPYQTLIGGTNYYAWTNGSANWIDTNGNSGNPFETTHSVVDGIGVSADVAALNAGKSTLAVWRNNYLKWKVYPSGWSTGNKTVKVLGAIKEGAEMVGHSALGISLALDVVEVTTGAKSKEAVARDVGIDALGVAIPGPGTATAVIYYGLETFYTGGAPGAVKDFARWFDRTLVYQGVP